uniref:Zinc knuckle CX2CX4HX4C domain-containing protein n=1 Tax=Gossypium raimondii TaxID=29730 RepID=A0A0D2TVT0_GOSRA|nr:hypothetical protein B456_009G264500 [Gossypium raimondii]
MEVRKLMGEPIKMDSHTSLVTRGNFIRIYVEIDLTKPLLSQVCIGRFIQNIEYEGHHTIYFSCSYFGYCMEACLRRVMLNDSSIPIEVSIQETTAMAEEKQVE